MNTPVSSPDLQQSALASDDIDLMALAHTLWREKLWIMLTGLIGLVAATYYAFAVAVPQYTASSVVMLEVRQDQVVDLDSVVSGISGDQAAVNTEVQVIRARGLIEKLVREMDLTSDPEFNPYLGVPPKYTLSNGIAWVREQIEGPKPPSPPPSERAMLDATINSVLSRISVANQRQSYVFWITAVTGDPKKSAAIADQLARLYIREQVEVKFEATEQATGWLSERVAELRIALETSENAVKDFNAGTDLVNLETLDGLNRQLKETRQRQDDILESIEIARAKAAGFEAAALSGDRTQMAEVAGLSRLDDLLERIEAGEGSAERLFDDSFDTMKVRAQTDLRRLEAQSAALAGSLGELEARLDRQSNDLLTLQQLRREAEANRLLYEYFLGRLKETSVQQGIQKADSRLLSSAVVPGSPSAPRKKVIMAVGLILGAVFGMAIVLTRELMQTGIRTADELENLTGQTVMGQIPAIPARRRKSVLKYLIEKPNSAAAEAVRNLRTSVLLANVDEPPKVIMSTSSLPGEGKTTQSLALTQNFAGLGKKVLLVEGDIRRQVFSQYFDISKKQGLLSILSGEHKLEDVVTFNEDLQADVLIGEASTTNAADVFSSRKFAEFLQHAKDVYDVVIIDTPPVLVVPDARVIGQSVDAILYTVKWDSTTRTQVRQGLRMFETVNLKVTGLVLGQIDAKGMKRYGYGGEYGAYGSYGAKYYHN